MLVQEGQTVGWDPRAFPVYYSLADRLYVFYSFGVVLLIGIWAIEFWRILGFSSHRTQLQLRRALALLRDGDFLGLASTAKKFRTASPEGGLRSWERLSAEIDRAAFFRVITDAEGIFALVADTMSATLLNLRRLVVLSGVLLAAWFSFQASYVFRGISLEKATGLATIAGGFQEALQRCWVGLLLLAAFYVVYWHFSTRLDRRRREWEHFCSQAKQLEQ